MNQAPIILAHPADNEGRGTYRVLHPVYAYQNLGLARVHIYTQFLNEESYKNLAPDIVVLSESTNYDQIELVSKYRKTNRKNFIVYDINDLLIDVPESNIHHSSIPKDIGERIKQAIKHVDAISVTTEPLKDALKRKYHFKDIRVVPNMIPRPVFDLVQPTKQPHDKPRIGWAGGISHGGDTSIIQHIADLLGDTVTWVFFGMMPDGMGGRPNVEFIQPVPMTHYYQTLASMNLDVAIAPLEENAFNECKSNLKLIEYGLLDVPVIASDFTPYQCNSGAILLPNQAYLWAEAIRDVTTGGLRNWVKDNYILDDHAVGRLKGWLPTNETPFIPQDAPANTFRVISSDIHSLPKGADIVLLRGDAAPLSESQLERLCVGDATMALHNNGLFPTPGQFVPIDPATAAVIDEYADNDESVPMPTLNGPAVYMSAKALAQVGTPRLDYDTEEASVMDWSLRAKDCKFALTCADNVFVASNKPFQITDADKKRLALRFPNLDMTAPKELSDSMENIELQFYGERYKTPLPTRGDYVEWAKVFDTPLVEPSSVFSEDFCIGVVMPMYNTDPDVLNAAVQSVLDQDYGNWLLTIVDDGSDKPAPVEYDDPRIEVITLAENSGISTASNAAIHNLLGKGVHWITFLDHDDTLSPIAFSETAKVALARPELNFIFADEDKLDHEGNRCEPYFKPAFDYERLLTQNYLSHYTAYKVTGDFPRLDSSFDGAQDYDFVLRYLESFGVSRKSIHHIPRVLYHWRKSDNSMAHNPLSKPDAIKQGVRAVIGHLKRTGQSAMVSTHPLAPIHHRVQFGVPEDQPKVLIVIPTKDHVDLLKPCIDSILGKTSYKNYEIAVVDNGSRDPETRKYLSNPKGFKVIRDDSPYNFSALNNRAVRDSDAEFIVTLNNDTQVVEGGWLNQMVGMGLRKGVGCVGAKLLYPDGRIQHAGVIRKYGMNLHIGVGQPAQYTGLFGINVLNHECCAVTAACMLIRKSIWDELGGLDEEYPVYFNDVDFGYRVMKAGYYNAVCMDAVLLHKESASLGRERTVEKQKALNDAGTMLNAKQPEADPYLNPQITLEGAPVWPAPWVKPETIENVLVINGKPEDVVDAFRKGASVFSATTVGAIMKIETPVMQHIKSWDMRGMDAEVAKRALKRLGITQVIVRNIGDGILEMLPFVERLGLPVSYEPETLEAACPRNFVDCDKDIMEAAQCQSCIDNLGTPFGFVDIDGWRNVWGRFLMNTFNDKEDAANLLGYVSSRGLVEDTEIAELPS